jgi:hypothetical protein
MNDALRVFYESIWSDIEAIRSRELDVSRPLLLEVPPGYERAATRVMIVGQETFGWGRPEENTVSLLQEGYRSFDRGRSVSHTPFWQAASTIWRLLNPDDEQRAFLWTNLVKVDQASHRPSQRVEDAISALLLVQREIEITQPDVVVFFTGPRYDERLCKTFPNVQFVQMSKAVARVQHPSLPVRCYRTYHPQYLRLRRQWSVLDQICADASGTNAG